MLILAMLQSVSGPVDPATVRRGCRPPTSPSEVVVCGRPGESAYRLRTLPARTGEPAIPAAAVKLKNGGTVAVQGQRGNVGPIPTNRAVVTLTMPF